MPSGLILIILGIIGVFYYTFQPHKNVSALKSDFKLSAKELFQQFDQNEISSNRKYIDKVIEVNGKVLDAKKTDTSANIQLATENEKGTINCSFILKKEEAFQLPLINSNIIIKGRCSGFLTDVNLVDCIIKQ